MEKFITFNYIWGAVISSRETFENNFIYIFFTTGHVIIAPKFRLPIIEIIK